MGGIVNRERLIKVAAAVAELAAGPSTAKAPADWHFESLLRPQP
jgi:hypothetical protein